MEFIRATFRYCFAFFGQNSKKFCLLSVFFVSHLFRSTSLKYKDFFRFSQKIQFFILVDLIRGSDRFSVGLS